MNFFTLDSVYQQTSWGRYSQRTEVGFILVTAWSVMPSITLVLLNWDDRIMETHDVMWCHDRCLTAGKREESLLSLSHPCSLHPPLILTSPLCLSRPLPFTTNFFFHYYFNDNMKLYLFSWRLDWWAPRVCWPPALKNLHDCRSQTCHGPHTAPADKAKLPLSAASSTTTTKTDE